MRRWRRWAYRVWQVWAVLTGAPDPAQRQQAQAALSPALWGLFCAMPWPEQAHALRVWAAVGGEAAPLPLQQAALLHDVGKALHRPALWERVLAVLGQALLPRQAARWAQGAPRGWRRAFVVAARHPAWGAAWVQAAGAHPDAVRLIAAHQTPPPPDAPWAPWLQGLQQADDHL